MKFLKIGLTAVGCAVALAACGGASQGSAPKAAAPKATQAPAKPAVAPNLTDEQQVQNTIREFNQAMLKGDGSTACSKMTPAGQQQAAQEFKYPNCTEAANAVGPALSQTFTQDQKNVYANPTFTGSTVIGNQADVAYNDGSFHRATLEKDGGNWLIVSVTG